MPGQGLGEEKKLFRRKCEFVRIVNGFFVFFFFRAYEKREESRALDFPRGEVLVCHTADPHESSQFVSLRLVRFQARPGGRRRFQVGSPGAGNAGLAWPSIRRIALRFAYLAPTNHVEHV